MKRLLICLVWLALSTSVYATQPERVLATYEIFSSGIKIGLVEDNYTRNKDHYTLTSTSTPLGLLAAFKPEKIFLRSEGLIDKHGLRPLRFENKREGGKESRAEFDWANQQLTLVQQEQRIKFALPDGTQDRLSAMYQFMFLQLENLSTLDFSMTNGSKLDNYHYAIGAQVKLNTPAGQFDSLYLDSQGKTGETRTEIWIAIQHNLPSKMIITDPSGDQFIQILSEIQIIP